MPPLMASFPYYGSKVRAALKYGDIRYKQIVEPFAGGAGVAHAHPECDVLLIDKDPRVCVAWNYLIHADPARIRRLPGEIPEGQDIRRIKGLSPAEMVVIGYWMNPSCGGPRWTPSPWTLAGKGWRPEIRERLADQVRAIRHWRIMNADYWDAPDIEATWFIDPPYQE